MEHFLNPEEAIDSMDFYGPMLVADFGAGAGYFSLPIAKKISKEGIVYALDIQEEPLNVLRKKAHDAHLYNIQTMRADLETPSGSRLTSECVDRIVIANILFQAPKKENVVKEAFRILKKEGKIIVVEWRNELLNLLGPRPEHRVSKEDVTALFSPLPCSIEKEFTIGDHHLGFIYKKTS